MRQKNALAEVRPLIEPALHEKLSIMADFKDMQVGDLAARILEKAIVGEWHEISLLIARSERLGKRWKAAEGPK